MKTAYKYITTQILPQPIDSIIQDGNETDKAIRSELALANAAPELLKAANRLIALIDSGEGITTLRKGLSLQMLRDAVAKASTN